MPQAIPWGGVVGGLVGVQNNGSITFSYATGNSGGGGLLAGWGFGTIDSSYGFGTGSNTYGGTPPSGVTSASGLTAANSGSSDTERWSTDAWDFGTSSQAPALKYVDSYGDHDGDDTTSDTYTCTSSIAFLPFIDITCGTTLLPNQR